MRSTFVGVLGALVLALLLPGLAAAADPAPGARPGFFREAWGLGFTVPPHWRTADKDGLLLLVSDTEAGLMIVRFLPRATRDELRAGYQQGLQESGFMAAPVEDARPFDVPGASGLAGVMEGQAQDGTMLRVRSIGVLSRHGGAVVVLALTTPAQFARLQSRADALARSIVFSAPPKAAPIAGDYQFIHVSQSGSYSREARLTLCASGRYRSSGEMAGSGAAGSAYSGSGQGGSWSATGDASGGSLLLQPDGGPAHTLGWRVSTNPRDRSGWGPALYIGNDLYQKVGEGRC
ncbi:MAG: hypothetical protein JNM33_01670 [Rubrivivax sp.]|nr:hypothetical protein [Rubrivivax sp.]